jgi:hypothetical protein
VIIQHQCRWDHVLTAVDLGLPASVQCATLFPTGAQAEAASFLIMVSAIMLTIAME